MHECLVEIYKWSYQNECLESIKDIYKKKLYLKPWFKFQKFDKVKMLMENMQCKKEMAETYMRKFHKFVRKT